MSKNIFVQCLVVIKENQNLTIMSYHLYSVHFYEHKRYVLCKYSVNIDKMSISRTYKVYEIRAKILYAFIAYIAQKLLEFMSILQVDTIKGKGLCGFVVSPRAQFSLVIGPDPKLCIC